MAGLVNGYNDVICSQAIQPFYKQICYWVVNGEIIDTHEEFFIKAENNLDSIEMKNSWDRQFVLRYLT